MGKTPNLFITLGGFLKKVGQKFLSDDGFTLSAALSFYAIFSLVPLTLIIISVFGHYLGQSDALFNQIIVWIGETLPNLQPEFVEFLKSLVSKKFTRGWIGLIALIFIASLLFSNIEHALEKIFSSHKKRNFWHSTLFSIGLTFLTCILFFVPTFGAFIVKMVEGFGVQIPVQTIFQGKPFFLFSHFFLFVMALWIIPRTKIHWRSKLIGAAIFSLMSLLAREVFKIYVVVSFDRFHFIYGSLALLVLLILWIYYLAMLFLSCAELVSVLERKQLLTKST
ncbi:MAG: YihY/virulence factor BrkB family protein [Deltaproteobacteria bacterium]|nr:YihY/virulence factor BrkB family protein [Deltaproteobacteria bacterium]